MDVPEIKPDHPEESDAGAEHSMTPDEMVDFEGSIVEGDQKSGAIPDTRVPPAAPD